MLEGLVLAASAITAGSLYYTQWLCAWGLHSARLSCACLAGQNTSLAATAMLQDVGVGLCALGGWVYHNGFSSMGYLLHQCERAVMCMCHGVGVSQPCHCQWLCNCSFRSWCLGLGHLSSHVRLAVLRLAYQLHSSMGLLSMACADVQSTCVPCVLSWSCVPSAFTACRLQRLCCAFSCKGSAHCPGRHLLPCVHVPCAWNPGSLQAVHVPGLAMHASDAICAVICHFVPFCCMHERHAVS